MNFIREKLVNSSIASNMLVSGICRPASMIVSYIYVPVVLEYLGVEKYGVWATMLTILSWIGYFDIGLGNGLRNRLTESLSSEDGYSRRLVSSAFALIAVFMSAATIAFSIVAMHINWNRIFGVSEFDENLRQIVIVSAIFIAINFVLSICKNIFYAIQKAADVSVLELATQVTNLVGVLVIRNVYICNLFALAVIYGLSMILVNLTACIVLFATRPEVRPGLTYVDMKVGRNIIRLGLQFFVIQICSLVLFTTDSVIISFLFGAIDVTHYNTVNKLFAAVIGMYSALLSPIWSAVTKAKIEKRYNDLSKLIKKLHLLMMPFICVALMIMIFFKPISKIWLRIDLDYPANLILYGFVYCILMIWGNTYGALANGLEIMKTSMSWAIVQALVNIPLSVFFAKGLNMGSAGVLVGTDVSLAISGVFVSIAINRLIAKQLNSSIDKE